MKNRETRKSFLFQKPYMWLQSIQMAVNWCPGSTRGGLLVIVWPHQELLPARISTSWPGCPGPRWQFRPSIGGTWGLLPPARRCLCPVSLPAITDSGQLVGRAGTSRLATYTTGAGHLYHQGLATYLRGQGQPAPELSANSITHLFN